MKQNKRFSALLLALVILFTLAPQVYFLIRADADYYTYDVNTGNCGDDLDWHFYHLEDYEEAEYGIKSNTLKITGSGDMWDDYKFMVSGEVFITSCADHSHYENFSGALGWEVAALDLSESMTSIGTKAFYRFGIKEAEIPKSVKRIGASAFEGCSRLESVTIKNASCEIFDSVETLGGYPEKTTIRGYVGSTAEAYAKKYGYAFEALTPNPFEDVKDTDYFYQAVLWAVGQGVTTGTSDTTFSPKNDCTRGQVVTFLWRVNGQPEPKSTAHSFVDIDANAYYYKAVLWAVENKITNGMDATHFMPKNTCTRGQVVTFLWRAKWEPAPKTTTHPFVDVDANAYYYQAMLWAVENKITNGMDDTHFKPNDVCNRAQVVTFLYRAKDAAAAPGTMELSAVISADRDYAGEEDPATLTVKAEGGTAPYTYKWQKYSESREMWGNSIGQTGTSYTVKSSGRYRCQVTDAEGTAVYSNELVLLPPE